MKDAVNKWAASHLLAMSAKYKQTHNKEVDDTVKSQLTQQRDALTSDWSEENCYGQSAVLTLKLMAAFYEQTLLLAYGQQTNDHLRIQIQEEVALIIEHARETQETPSLDRLFRTFRAKYADLTGAASQSRQKLQLLHTMQAQMQQLCCCSQLLLQLLIVACCCSCLLLKLLVVASCSSVAAV